jgi:hypothetical protein
MSPSLSQAAGQQQKQSQKDKAPSSTTDTLSPKQPQTSPLPSLIEDDDNDDNMTIADALSQLWKEDKAEWLKDKAELLKDNAALLEKEKQLRRERMLAWVVIVMVFVREILLPYTTGCDS